MLVHRLAQSVVDRAQLASPEVEIRLTAADNLAPVDAEPTYVQQILRNLLSNALKYGKSAGQPIEVNVVQSGQWIETRVLDRGVGFGPGDSDRLFTLFYRNPKVVCSAPGAGIGLYVCRLLAEAMGGTVGRACGRVVGQSSASPCRSSATIRICPARDSKKDRRFLEGSGPTVFPDLPLRPQPCGCGVCSVCLRQYRRWHRKRIADSR